MSYLANYAKNKSKKSETVTSRVPTDVYQNFKKHCDSLGLTISEAVLLLIKNELN